MKESVFDSYNQDSKFEKTSTLKHADETISPVNVIDEKEKENEKIRKNKISPQEIEILVDKKRSELDIKIFDMVTKNQIEEKKIEDLHNNEEDEEQKVKLLEDLKELSHRNEKMIQDMKEYLT